MFTVVRSLHHGHNGAKLPGEAVVASPASSPSFSSKAAKRKTAMLPDVIPCRRERSSQLGWAPSQPFTAWRKVTTAICKQGQRTAPRERWAPSSSPEKNSTNLSGKTTWGPRKPKAAQPHTLQIHNGILQDAEIIRSTRGRAHTHTDSQFLSSVFSPCLLKNKLQGRETMVLTHYYSTSTIRRQATVGLMCQWNRCKA